MRASTLLFAVILAAFPLPDIAGADTTAALPVTATAGQPALLLDLGREPVTAGFGDHSVRVITGQAYGNEAGVSISTEKDEVVSAYPGLGNWKIGFRFSIQPRFPGGNYNFWARWRQGGDPNASVQSFEVWAGSDPANLQLRATVSMAPKGWDYAWIAAEAPVRLRDGDAVIEVRNSGSGHDAKVFDAFLLASPLSSLPASGTVDKPLVLLDLGKAPAIAAVQKNAGLQVQTGIGAGGYGATSVLTENDEVQVFHQGFGDWGATFHFDLDPATVPGQYRFFARYKSGGEVSQVSQNFIVKAGAKSGELAPRGNFTLINDTPWQYQWLQAPGSLLVLPGDRRLEIANSGKADGAKVFDAFLLKLDAPIGGWMNAGQVQARQRFLALTKTVSGARRRLYVLDGKGSGDDILFRGLAADASKPSYDVLPVAYLIGAQAEALAYDLNIPALPALVMTDDKYTVTGVLFRPITEQAVAAFLADPAGRGIMPVPVTAGSVEMAKPLRKGVPESWLVGGLQAGLAGLSVFAMDSETVVRPNPDQPYLSLQMAGGQMRTWQPARTQADGSADIEAKTAYDYSWSHGSAYAHLYVHADHDTKLWLHLQQSGSLTAAWLDGQPLELAHDPKIPDRFTTAVKSAKRIRRASGPDSFSAAILTAGQQQPKRAALNLARGWHNLLVKLVMQHRQGQRFHFAGIFTDQQGRPADSIKTQLSDPEVDSGLNKIAAKLRPLIFLDAPANLPHPDEPLKLRVDLRWHPILEETGLPGPLPAFQANLKLRVVDYDGNEVAVREIAGLFPGVTEVELGKLAEAGYYAVYPSLYGADGKLVMNYPADGFSVIGGAVEQKLRLDKKKLWNNYYYALADGDKSFIQDGGYFSWLERMGIYKSYGAYPGFDEQYRPEWRQAQLRGLELFADSSGDSAWLNDNPGQGKTFIAAASVFTRYFKSTNEIDIRSGAEWQKLRDPEHWLQRAKLEYEQAHRQRSDAHYVGGSLVRPGDAGQAGTWFKQVLQLGLEHYHDAWDIHAYPQQAPRFGGAIGNAESEDERGVLAAYASLGRSNKLPFWLGETGAKAMHGLTGRRWQAEQVAKMIAWVNSRKDYLGLAFCIGHEYDSAFGRIWDYSMGHKPGEAALYTAGALIDGLPYRAVATNDSVIQAAYFGDTLMIWRADDADGNWRMPLSADKRWLLVDVVGRIRELAVDKAGYADIPISGSPVYILARADYERLTRR